MPGERLIFWGFFDGVLYTYTYKKNVQHNTKFTCWNKKFSSNFKLVSEQCYKEKLQY